MSDENGTWYKVKTHDTLIGVPSQNGDPYDQETVLPGQSTELPARAAKRLAKNGYVTILSPAETP